MHYDALFLGEGGEGEGGGKGDFLGGGWLKVEWQKVSRGGRWMAGKEDEGAAWGRGEVCRGDGMNVFFGEGGVTSKGGGGHSSIRCSLITA